MTPDLEKLQQQIDELKLRLNKISPDNGRSADISDDHQNSIREIVSDKVSDILWDEVFIVSSFAAESVTTSSSTEDYTAKEVDTSAGKLFDPTRSSKYRVNFYLGSGQTNSTVYICSPAVNTGFSAITAPMRTNTTTSYVGVKILRGVIYLVSYDPVSMREKLILTKETILDNTTHTLEFHYRPGQSSDIYYDNKLLGSIPNNLTKKTPFSTFYPYLTAVSSASGSVNLTLENYQFMQERK